MSNNMTPLEMADFLRGIAHLQTTGKPLDHEEAEMLREIAAWIDDETERRHPLLTLNIEPQPDITPEMITCAACGLEARTEDCELMPTLNTDRELAFCWVCPMCAKVAH